ncbi:hypothetical protein PCE1_000711 [Barthelona sp. PCE]
MSEIVQRQLESCLPELQEYLEKELFTKNEISKILDRRRHFEYLLLKRTPEVSDFLEYIQYESALKLLKDARKKEKSVTKLNNDHFLTQRVQMLFNRAANRFPGDLKLWNQYLTTLIKDNSVKQLNGVLARAIALHPREPMFWKLGAEVSVANGDFDAARNLLLRSLSGNNDCNDLWAAYAGFEVSYLEFLRSTGVLKVYPGDSDEQKESKTNLAAGTTLLTVLDGALEAGVSQECLRQIIKKIEKKMDTELLPQVYGCLDMEDDKNVMFYWSHQLRIRVDSAEETILMLVSLDVEEKVRFTMVICDILLMLHEQLEDVTAAVSHFFELWKEEKVWEIHQDDLFYKTMYALVAAIPFSEPVYAFYMAVITENIVNEYVFSALYVMNAEIDYLDVLQEGKSTVLFDLMLKDDTRGVSDAIDVLRVLSESVIHRNTKEKFVMTFFSLPHIINDLTIDHVYTVLSLFAFEPNIIDCTFPLYRTLFTTDHLFALLKRITKRSNNYMVWSVFIKLVEEQGSLKEFNHWLEIARQEVDDNIKFIRELQK